ncbi:MAG TPA: hypothetical protein VIJ82_26965 [Streptosporangiaceae bacterium]|jgi:hypothetical protein
MTGTNAASAAGQPLTVDLDLPSAQVLADQAGIIQDLQFVMECCKRLLTELARPEEERDAVIPLALWSSALVSYARCFSSGKRFGLTADDVLTLPLQGEVLKYHKWVIEERNKHTRHSANPFEVAKVGAALAPPEARTRRVEGIAILSMSHVLVDATGVRQLGGLASELAKQTAEKAKAQQDVVLADAQGLTVDRLYELPQLRTSPPAEDDPAGEGDPAEEGDPAGA